MADRKGGYALPTATTWITSSHAAHKARRPPSSEPGTDYGAPFGSTLRAPEDGTVVDVKTTTSGAMGRFIAIDLNDGRRTRSIHLSRVDVHVGQKVKRGQAIGLSGASAWGLEWGVGAHVHQSLWDFHGYKFTTSGTIDFHAQVGADNDGLAAPAPNQTVKDRQNWLNQSRGEKLVVDGVVGKNTTAAIKRYQTFLAKSWGYKGAIDGIWGAGTQTAHQKYWNDFHKKPLNPAYHRATVDDLASLTGNVGGFQKIAHLYGYGKGQPASKWLDYRWGPGTRAGMQAFLDQNYGGSLAAWLRAKWGYRDRDDNWGPNMRAAANRAEVANFKALGT